tara:strand:+ start:1236 stop:1982 length:747 start_codon:yes stop_codon:yes gene_type:complete
MDKQKNKKYRGIRGLKCRHDVDRRMITDCIRNYKYFSFDENSIVLDLGCNIGGIMYWLKDAKIKQYIGVDAFEENIEFYKKNNLPNKPNYEIFYGAATMDDGDTHSFWIYEDDVLGSSNGQSNPTKTGKRKIERKVPNFNINDLIEKYKPTHLKMDIKGTEMIWMEKNGGKIPDCVEQWFAEIYGHNPSECYDTNYFPIQKTQGFDLTFIYPTERFKKMGKFYNLPNLGKHNVEASLFDVNVLLSRKK